jgi:hypothetical protein
LLSRLAMLNGGLRIRGHDQVTGGSWDVKKVCPGPLLRLDEVVAATKAAMAPGWETFGQPQVEEILGRAGLVL